MSSLSLFSKSKSSIKRMLDASDTLRMAMLLHDEESVLPELISTVGVDKLDEFLEVFGGLTIRIPTRAEFDSVIGDIETYYRVKASIETVAESAIRREITVDDATKRYERVRSFAADSG